MKSRVPDCRPDQSPPTEQGRARAVVDAFWPPHVQAGRPDAVHELTALIAAALAEAADLARSNHDAWERERDERRIKADRLVTVEATLREALDELEDIYRRWHYEFASDDSKPPTDPFVERARTLLARPETRERLARARVSPADHQFRTHLWSTHGHLGVLYGDDGEMQCSACHADYKRDPLEDLEAKAIKARLEVLAQARGAGENVRVEALAAIRNKTIIWPRHDEQAKTALLRDIHRLAADALDGPAAPRDERENG